ncbi:Tumor protein D52 [Larimichthys crocea]|uniref:Tumor protein D52 n=1 Tax=Larimichthys crocea TaxID=215358 RepID=A0A6G0INH1_LARCR|nr:Tumor protein D52 [Larimichthys crocea]
MEEEEEEGGGVYVIFYAKGEESHGSGRIETSLLSLPAALNRSSRYFGLLIDLYEAKELQQVIQPALIRAVHRVYTVTQSGVKVAAMNRPGFGGASSSLSFSSRVTENGCSPSDLTEEDLDGLRIELSQMEDEIQTLRQVLLVKEKCAADIRRQLGMSPLNNLKQNLSKGWQDVQTSGPYLTASATLDDISHSDIYVRTTPGSVPCRPGDIICTVQYGHGHHQESGRDESSASPEPATVRSVRLN